MAGCNMGGFLAWQKPQKPACMCCDTVLRGVSVRCMWVINWLDAVVAEQFVLFGFCFMRAEISEVKNISEGTDRFHLIFESADLLHRCCCD